jgi:hypothetical protein
VNGRWVVSGPLTALALLPLGGAATAALHGTAARPPSGQAPLVVAEPAGGGPGLTGIADRDGSWAIFNLAPGTSYVVTAYAKGANYVPSLATGTLDPGANVTVQPLGLAAAATATIAGNLIFNYGASPPMQVSLVVDSTYVTTLDRGESPPGLTADVAAGAGEYTLTGVPDGKYVVLAAFGRDGKVRDVSGTGNTAAPRVTVSGGSLQEAPPGFKIIPAVDLDGIGGVAAGADPVLAVSTATPSFAWTSGNVDAQADVYRLLVFDAFGNTAWSHDEPATAGSHSVAYAGAPLRDGAPYQLRILAIKKPAEQLSQTEDVAGVFTVRP